jgi:hypothetical protein
MNRFERRLLTVLALAITADLMWLPTVVHAGLTATAID